MIEDDDKTYYQDATYWSLPENVRHAIDLSKKKTKHSDFYNQLQGLNDKINLYKKVFYTNTTKHQKAFDSRRKEKENY